MARLILSLFFTFAVASLAAEPVFAEVAHGVLEVVKGNVEILSKGTKRTAKVGEKVYQKDKIITHADSRAKIVMTDKNELHVSPDSQFIIEHYENNPATGKKKVDLSLLQGKIRSSVKEKYDGNENTYRVKTPTAVAGVRGTDFLTGYDRRTGSSEIVTFSGIVEAASRTENGRLSNFVRVTPGTKTTVASGSSPTPPTNVPNDELLSMSQESASDEGLSDSGNSERIPSSSNPSEDGPTQEDQGSSQMDQSPESSSSPSSAREPAAGDSSVSMIDSNDVSADIGNTIVVNESAQPPAPINFDSAANSIPQQLPTNEFADEVIRVQKSKGIITINRP